MEGAIDVLNEYFKSIGGRQSPRAKSARADRRLREGNQSRRLLRLAPSARRQTRRRRKWHNGVHHQARGNTTSTRSTQWSRRRTPRQANSKSSHTSCGTIIKRHNILSNTSTKSVRKRCVAMTIEIVLLLMRCRCWHTMRVT